MSLPASAKYLVIGAGVHGLSTAWHLAKEQRARGEAGRGVGDLAVGARGARTVHDDGGLVGRGRRVCEEVFASRIHGRAT